MQNFFSHLHFRVIFDGIELRRHIQLPTEEQVVPKLYFIDFKRQVFGSCLKFSVSWAIGCRTTTEVGRPGPPLDAQL